MCLFFDGRDADNTIWIQSIVSLDSYIMVNVKHHKVSIFIELRWMIYSVKFNLFVFSIIPIDYAVPWGVKYYPCLMYVWNCMNQGAILAAGLSGLQANVCGTSLYSFLLLL